MFPGRILASLVLGSALLNAHAVPIQSKPLQATQPQTSSSTQQTDKSGSFAALENKNSMRITLKASRDQATAGSNFGITAEIENTSSNPIYIIPSAIAMTVPPELDANAPHDLWAFIPGVQVPQEENYWNTVIVLEPGATTSAFWSGGNVSGSPDKNTSLTWKSRTWQTFLSGLAFSPGRYTLSVVGSYWDTYEGAKSKSVERHTETFEIQETITAPQSVILFGAALGGLIAFILLTKLQPTNTTGWSKIGWLTGSVSAILLSTIVTILIARLSQNQFIISVSVNDLWGAIAVGFMVTAAGPAILRKFSNAITSSGSTAGGNGASIRPDASSGQTATSDGNAPGSPKVQPAADQDKQQSSPLHEDSTSETDSAARVPHDADGDEEMVEQNVANTGARSNNGRGNE